MSWPGEFPADTHYMELTPLRTPRRDAITAVP
ncbi:hypothetical protein MPLSOD_110043 [Mesorhizobium sp. SOD10]|nr:hypothetical protein MPLSOD_110043 [Mesorhizobium sp. SOD10]